MASEADGHQFEHWRKRDDWERRRRERVESALRRKIFPMWLAGCGWQWFVTFTFKPRPTKSGRKVRPGYEWAKKLLHRALNKMCVVLFGRRYRRRGHGITLLIAWELHQDGRPHAHALAMGVPNSLTYQDLNGWFAERTGWAKWLPMRKGAAEYVAKYVAKGGVEAEWEIYGPTRKLPKGPLFESG